MCFEFSNRKIYMFQYYLITVFFLRSFYSVFLRLMENGTRIKGNRPSG